MSWRWAGGVCREPQRRERADAALAAMEADHLARRAAGRCRAASVAACIWPGRCRCSPTSCCSTSRSPALTPRRGQRCSTTPATALRAWTAAALVVVHDRAEAWALADRLLILLGGRLVADGPPRELLEASADGRWRAFWDSTGDLTPAASCC